MLVEALRLIVVVAAVFGASRITAANPRVLGDVGPEQTVLLASLLAAGIAYIVGGVVARTIDRALRGAEEKVARRHAADIVAATLGLLIGAFASILFAWPLLVFVEPFYLGAGVAAFVSLVLISFTTRLAVRKRLELFGVLGVSATAPGEATGGCLLDSSAAIDGRVLALYKAGLLPQPICVPAFIIWEMQGIADSSDPLRRRRGRRGLDMLGSLKEAGAHVRVLEDDPTATTDADAKLIVVARRRGMPIVTSDSNLAKVAEVQGLGVLSLHKLAELMRPPVMVGERMRVRLLKEGKEAGQAVAFLDDGTMVVVERASELLGKDVDVEVTTVLQQDTGRIVFSKIPTAGEEEPPDAPSLREVR
jgi:uncharacterized protein YacL